MADIKKELNDIKNAVYGREVRGSIHDSIYKVNRESEGSRQIANNTKQRQDAVEQQFNTLLSEWSDDKPIDNAETIAARTNTKESKTYENLGKRLDEEYGKTITQLAHTEQQITNLENNKLNVSVGATKQELNQKEIEIKSYLNNQLTQIGSMTPKGAFATLQDLKSAYPNGADGVYIVQADGHWYYWNGSDWTDGGLYQAMSWVIPSPTEIASNLVIPAKTTTNITGVITINDAAAFSVGIRTHGIAPNISLYVKPVVGGFYADLGTAYLINNRVINASQAISKKYLIKSPSLAIFLKNNEDYEITVSAYLYKSNNTAETVNELNEKEYYGGTVEDRPSGHIVDVGAIYMATETQETWINTPTGWVKI